jgi:hypothetical protein
MSHNIRQVLLCVVGRIGGKQSLKCLLFAKSDIIVISIDLFGDSLSHVQCCHVFYSSRTMTNCVLYDVMFNFQIA